MSFETISGADACHYIGNNGIRFIDLRDREEYLKGHIPGAMLIPYDIILKEKQRLLKYKIIILYCDRGNVSLLAARELAAEWEKEGRKDTPAIKNICYGIIGYRGQLEKGMPK